MSLTKKINPSVKPSDFWRLCQSIKRKLPRTESCILLVGLACTVFAKLIILQHQNLPFFFIELLRVVFPDIFFFIAVFALIRCLYILRQSVVMARISLLIAAVVAVWSVLNAVWLLHSGVQLQPGILKVFIFDLKKLWPLLVPHLKMNLGKLCVFGIMGFLGLVFFLWRFIKPVKIKPKCSAHMWRGLAIFLLILALLLALPFILPNKNASFVCEVLNFSSHWQVLASTLSSYGKDQLPPVQTRNIARVGQRKIGLPECSQDKLPNVVLVLLESISYTATSLDKTSTISTPNLVRLANQGVEFRLTRVPVPYTTKAFWVALTSTDPIIQTDNVEAILAEPPYEGLPSILARVGYGSGFFEMSKGNFECAPGLFSNMAFDWAWFRENLGDPSAYLGYMDGDDCRMLKPAFDWAQTKSEPFLLMMITSVSHDPFEVPSWFEQPKEKLYDRYQQSVRYNDYFLGQLDLELRKRGLDKNTILCIMGDHGTSFRPQMGKGRLIPYEEVIRVPWIVRWPGHIQAGQIIEQPCSQLDVTPTLLSLIGFDISDANFEGMDALHLTESDNRRFYFSSLFEGTPLGFVQGTRKVVYWPDNNKVFEYDLIADPNEQNPKLLPLSEAKQAKYDIMVWQKRTQIDAEVTRYTERLLFSHWQVFSTGRSAWAYYVP